MSLSNSPLTLDLILSNPALRSHEFPVVTKKIFMAHAGVAPLPRRAAEAVQNYVWEVTEDFQECGDFYKNISKTRAAAGRLIGVDSEWIALIGPTALGLNLVALGLSWERGDEAVYYPGDYPSNVYPWKDLERRGVRLVALEPSQTGQITPELVFQSLSSKTKLVALSSCHYLTGYRLDYQTIGSELKKRGILFCLDSIQSLGATPLDAQYFDFLSADSHKWLLGPIGAGIFYVNPELYDRFHPTLLGSLNVNSPGFVAQTHIEFHRTAQRFEIGAMNGLGIRGMQASLELISEIGVEAIHQRLLVLHHYFIEKINEKKKTGGWTIVANHFEDKNRSGTVTLTNEKSDLKSIVKHLEQNQVVASLRWDLQKRPHLRFSPHFYNTFEEIDQVVELL